MWCNNFIFVLHFHSGKEENQTEIEKSDNKTFYGPATSCEELLKIGFTRNGFYLVKSGATTNSSHVEVVDCLFEHPNGVKEKMIYSLGLRTNLTNVSWYFWGINIVTEKRLGFISLTNKETKFHQRRSVKDFIENNIMKRPKRLYRLLPFHILQ